MSKVTVPEGFAIKVEDVDPGFTETINDIRKKHETWEIENKTEYLLEVLPDA